MRPLGSSRARVRGLSASIRRSISRRSGRDHNIRAMTIWAAGGGVKGGTVVGETDEFGNKAVSDIYKVRDVHTTVLHLMGLNDLQLTYYHAGRNMRLTDTGGNKIDGILA